MGSYGLFIGSADWSGGGPWTTYTYFGSAAGVPAFGPCNPISATFSGYISKAGFNKQYPFTADVSEIVQV